jgi:hypothetical protein
MNLSRLAQAAALSAAVASVSLFAGHSLVFAAQNQPSPQEPPPGAPGGQPPHEMPAPKNLQVLPKNLTGKEVHEIMEKWEGELGVHCNTCHAADPNRKGSNGRPALNFADDSKKEKQTARKMFKMTGEINGNYTSKIDPSAAPVTCGTCHRGHLDPEAFVPAPEHEDHNH